MELGKPGQSSAVALLRHVLTRRRRSLSIARRSTRIDGPTGKQPVNRERIYDFYAKEAEYFRKQPGPCRCLPPLSRARRRLARPLGQPERRHLGRRPLERDRPRHGPLRRLPRRGVTVPKGVCVRLGDRGELAACFNPETLCYEALWTGRIRQVLATRHGFLDGLILDGTPLPRPQDTKPDAAVRLPRLLPTRQARDLRLPDRRRRDARAPWVEDGKFIRHRRPGGEHPLADLTRGRPGAVAAGA